VANLNAKFQGAPAPKPLHRSGRSQPRHTRAPEGDPDAELDLHGATQEQAIRRVQGFLLLAHRQKLRHVLIITGRGLGSGEHGPVLRDAVTRWLERNGGPYIRDFHPAPPRHGGAGALWIVMR
jgi:DNA-nicking Smr family endonuclease